MTKEEIKSKIIHKMMNHPKQLINGLITIGYDFSKEAKDHCCLIVAQPRGNQEIAIINEFYDEEADNLFRKLMGDNNE